MSKRRAWLLVAASIIGMAVAVLFADRYHWPTLLCLGVAVTLAVPMTGALLWLVWLPADLTDDLKEGSDDEHREPVLRTRV